MPAAQGSSQATIDAVCGGLDYFARTTGHPELRYTAIIHTGLSASGRQAIFLGNAMPRRTLAVIVYSPATTLPKPLDTTVPVLINMGGLDLKYGNPISLDRNIILPAGSRCALGGTVSGQCTACRTR